MYAAPLMRCEDVIWDLIKKLNKTLMDLVFVSNLLITNTVDLVMYNCYIFRFCCI
jgi:hypothetical protein